MSIFEEYGAFNLKGNGYSFRDGNSEHSFAPPSEKGCTVKGKNLLPMGANTFLLQYTLFRRSKLEVTKLSLVQNGGK